MVAVGSLLLPRELDGSARRKLRNMRPRWKYEDKVVDYAMEVDCAKMVDYIRQVNDTGSKQLVTLP